MPAIPPDVKTIWERRNPIAVFCTAGTDGSPNAIWVSNLAWVDGERIAIADNAFHKTRANLLRGGNGSILILTPKLESLQFKGPLSYSSHSADLEAARAWANPQYPLIGVAYLHVTEVFAGATKLL